MNPTNTKIKSLIKWLALTMLRASIVITGYALYVIIRLAEYALIALSYIGRLVDVRIVTGLENEAPDYALKFSEDEIDSLAKTVKENETIEEISARLKLSYRQARKIKQAIDDRLNINNFNTSAVPA